MIVTKNGSLERGALSLRGPLPLESAWLDKNGSLDRDALSLESGLPDENGSLGRGPPSLESGLPVKSGLLERCPPSLEGALRRWKAECLRKVGRWKATPFGVIMIYKRVGVGCPSCSTRSWPPL